jgi:hypothetical protein
VQKSSQENHVKLRVYTFLNFLWFSPIENFYREHLKNLDHWQGFFFCFFNVDHCLAEFAPARTGGIFVTSLAGPTPCSESSVRICMPELEEQRHVSVDQVPTRARVQRNDGGVIPAAVAATPPHPGDRRVRGRGDRCLLHRRLQHASTRE